MEVNIAYASETGTTLELVKEFYEHCCLELKLSIKSVKPLQQDFEFQQGIWIFFIATTGQGDPPYSMRSLWKKMMNKNYSIKEELKFSVYSIGDTSYGDNFAMAARKFRQRLRMLGCQQIVEIGLGDQQDPNGYREVYLKQWLPIVDEFLVKNCKKEGQNGFLKESKVRLRNLDKQFDFKVSDIIELNNRQSRKVYWIGLQYNKDKVKPKTGDIIELYPHNFSHHVAFIEKYFKLDNLQQQVSYKNGTFSLRTLLKQHLNLSSILNYSFFLPKRSKRLCQFTSEQSQKEKLIQFEKGFEQYHYYITQFKRNVTELLNDFELTFNFDEFKDRVNQVIGRKYSIAKIDDCKVWILVKLVQFNVNQNKQIKGLCSHDLLTALGQTRRGKILPGQFTQTNQRKYNILISLGTGIAPFISLLTQKSQKQNYLIYTNRHQDELYHQIISMFIHQEVQAEEHISLTGSGGLRIIRLIQQKEDLFRDILSKEGISNVRIYLCGPKQLCQFAQIFMSKILETTIAEIRKKKMIIYQNW